MQRHLQRQQSNMSFFYASNLASGYLYLNEPVLQELLYSAVGALNAISRVTATKNMSEKSHGIIFENVIFHTSNLHIRSLYLD